ncbi:transposase [Geomonas sp. Red276]
MARPLRIEFPGAYYHVTSRGDGKKGIYRSPRDRGKFLEYLSSATERYGANILCYCLMTNHYHLFFQTPHGNLSEIMRHINGAYTTYYNTKWKHAGHLFQGRYHAILVEADHYALELTRYVHLNPVRAEIVPTPVLYRWSSYSAYIGNDQAPGWLHTNFILGMLSQGGISPEKRYQGYVEEMIGKEYESPLLQTVGSSILGSAEFVENVMADYVEREEIELRDVPAVHALHRRFHVENFILKVEEAIKDPELARDIGVYLCHRFSGERLKEIGTHFNLTDSGVGKAHARAAKKIVGDRQLQDKVNEIIKSLGYVNLKS